jgi:SAM-dependent methyltransferase
MAKFAPPERVKDNYEGETMPYQFAKDARDYSDYASGRVLYGRPGHPAFPVRLTSEIFQRCVALRQQAGHTGRVTVYDPCCGSGYALATLAYLHWPAIAAMLDSDVDRDLLAVAAQNMALLTPSGLRQRTEEVRALWAHYGKSSHADALESLTRLRQQLQDYCRGHQVATRLFSANALNANELVAGVADQPLDVVMTDIPYGRCAEWDIPTSLRSSQQSPLWHLLEALVRVVSHRTIVAIATDKAQRCDHAGYQQVGQFQIGKRRVFVLRTRS